MRGLKPCGKVRQVSSKQKPKVRGLVDFAETYDKSVIIPRQVRAGLKMLGRRGWMPEVDFAREIQVSLPNLGMFREMFSAYIVELPDRRRAWAGSPELAKQMRKRL